MEPAPAGPRHIGDILRDLARDGALPEMPPDPSDPDAQFLRALGIAPYAPYAPDTERIVDTVPRAMVEHVRSDPFLHERVALVYGVLDTYERRGEHLTGRATAALLFDAVVLLRDDSARAPILSAVAPLLRAGERPIAPAVFKEFIRAAHEPSYRAICAWHLRTKGWGA